MTWVRCCQTLWVFVSMGKAIAWLQLCSLFLRHIQLPLVLVIALVASFFRRNRSTQHKSTPQRNGSKGSNKNEVMAASVREYLLTSGSADRGGNRRSSGAVALCMLYARRHSIDATFCRLLRAQADRERQYGTSSALFVAVPEAGAHKPPSLSPASTLALIESLSVIIGADIFMSDLHNHSQTAPPASTSPNNRRSSSSSTSSKVHATQHTVAVMMPNSIYYPALWMGISKASEVLTTISVASSSCGSSRGHTCSAALLNTSIANNAMFSRSVASSGAQMVIVDASYVHLLFAEDADEDHRTSSDEPRSAMNKKAPKPRVSAYTKYHHTRHHIVVPPSVKKILLWNNEHVSLLVGGGDVIFGELPCGITVSQLQAIAEFNDDVCTAPRRKHRLYGDAGEELACLWLSNMALHSLYPSTAVQRALKRNAAAVGPSDSQNLTSMATPPLAASQLTPGGLTSPPMKAFDLDSSFNDDVERGSKTPGKQQQRGGAPRNNGSNGGMRGTSSSASSLATTTTTSSSSHGSHTTTSSNSTPSIRGLNGSGVAHATPRPRNISPLQAVASYPSRVTASLPYDYADLILEHVGVTLIDPPHSFPSWRRMWSIYRSVVGSHQAVDPILKIFTSGTTGLPKAAKFTHLRFHMGILLAGQADVAGRTRRLFPQSSDYEDATRVLTTYNCLPMYHSAGSVFCTSHLICAMQAQLKQPCYQLRQPPANQGGGSSNTAAAPAGPWGVPSARMVVRKKFSATNYAVDLEKYRVHIVQYIGEILRYAVAATPPPSSSPSRPSGYSWRVPVALGNGLRPDVWRDALTVLPIATVVEFYASTEGNVGMINIFDEPFAVGHLPVFPWPFQPLSPLFWPLFPMKLVVYDADQQAPRRYPDRQNHCRTAKVGEVGEMLGKVPRQGGVDPIGLRRFDGYHDASETKKKLLYNVLRDGDMYFRSGDLLRVDRRGFVSFVDRIGDTFRWKGENVSTLEVANALNGVATRDVAIQDAVVYGVAVPGREGKAGMAKFSLLIQSASTVNSSREALSVERRFLRDDVYSLLSSRKAATSLPPYAIPLFLRVSAAAAIEPPTVVARRGSRGTVPTEVNQEDDSMTGTFKHRPVVLASESYHSAVPRTYQQLYSQQLQEPPQQQQQQHVQRRQEDRFYVLVPTKLLRPKNTAGAPEGAVIHPASSSGGVAEPLWTYVPLHDDLLETTLGTSFELCGW